MTTKPSRPIFDAAALKREFPGLADPKLHYLDNAATAQMPDVVLNALRRFEVEARANVHEGMHARARAATDSYNQARASVARFLHANLDQEVVFTYGTTSSINLLAHSFGDRLEPGDEILLSVLEHHSKLVPWQMLAKRRGVVLRFLPKAPDGRLDLEWLETELTDRCRLVALTHCSNVTGAMTDVSRMVAAARAVGAKVMLDGAQRTPHGPLDLRKLDVDFYAFSGPQDLWADGNWGALGPARTPRLHAAVHDGRPNDPGGHAHKYDLQAATAPVRGGDTADRRSHWAWRCTRLDADARLECHSKARIAPDTTDTGRVGFNSGRAGARTRG